MSTTPANGFDRRTLLRGAGVGAGSLATISLLAACGIKGSSAASGDTLKIGFVSPQTGPLAGFASSDNFVVKQISDLTRKGFKSGGGTKQLKIVVKDTQSSATRASDVTRQLITQDKVDLVVASGTPDTTNPVADACEAAGIPNITTIAPWESWFYGRNGKDGVGFKYSTLFFFGMQQFADCFFPMWEKVGVSQKEVACLWPDDTDANAFRSGLGAAMRKASYVPVDGGKYNDGASDYTSQIAKFKAAHSELFTCTPIPPDFQTYWKQAVQQGFKPKLATVAKVMLFPSEAEALGQLSNNIATDIWWSPGHPYHSTLDGGSAAKLAEDFAQSSGKQWTQALGSVYSLFEIAVQAFKQAGDPRDRAEVADKLQKMNITGMSGTLDFTKGPQPGVAIQHPVGGQWRPGKKFPWDITIVENTPNPAVPLQGDLAPTFA